MKHTNSMTEPVELDEWGLAVWRHKNRFVERSYYWCDRAIVFNEATSRHIVDDCMFTTFDFTDPLLWKNIRR